MFQRKRYQPITVSACSTLSTGCVVSKRQQTASPGGGLSSRTSIANSSSIPIGASLRPTDANASEAHRHASRSSAAFAGPRRQVEHKLMSRGQARQSREQPAPVSQAAVSAGPRQKVGTCIRKASPFFVDIALAVVDDRDHGGLGQNLFGLVPALHPAIRL